MWNSLHYFHIGAWLAWLLAGLLAAMLTRNPYYMTLVMLAAGLVSLRLSRAQAGADSAGDRSWLSRGGRGFAAFVRAMAGLLVLVALLKGLSIHEGATVFFTLPQEWPLIGGNITLEAMVFAGLDALSLLTVFAVVAAFAAGADYYGLLRSVPAFMHQAGLVTSIAITFVPQTVMRFTEVREAQALRGHRLRRAGDLVPLVVPLLAGGMERSVNLAEAMEARGFSRAAGQRAVSPLAVQGGLVGGLGLILSGAALPAFVPGFSWVGWSCIAIGAGLVGLTLWSVGLGTERTRYRRSRWHDHDTVLAVASLAVILVLLAYRFLAPSVLVYNPLARLRIYAPGFEPVIAGAVLALALPALLVGMARNGQSTLPLEQTTEAAR